MSFPVAVSSYSFQGPIKAGLMNLFGYLEIIYSRFNVRQADISTDLLPIEIVEPEFLHRINNFFYERDVTLACLSINGPQLWSDDPDKRQADYQLIIKYLEAARRMNACTASIQLGSHAHSDVLSAEALETIVVQYRELCQFYGDYGLRIGPANLGGFSRLPENLKKIRDAVDHPAYGHLLRVGSWPAGRGREMIDTCLPILMHVHFPAESILWVKDLLRRIARTSYDGAYSIIQSCEQYELVRADWQISVLRGLIAELKEEGLEEVTPPGYFCQMAKVAPPDGILEI
jgi:hypothetical protein